MNLSAWLYDGVAIPEGERAALAWSRILDKPTSVVLKTASGVNRAAQTVRIEVDNRSSLANSAVGAAPRMAVIVYGIKNHPTLPDTIMAEGDRFVLNNDSYRIEDIILTLGEIQGVAVATG